MLEVDGLHQADEIEEQPVQAESPGRRSLWSSLRYDLVLVLLSTIWGGTFLVTKDTLQVVGPFTYLGLCYAVGTLTLVIIFHRRLLRLTRVELISGGMIGLFLFAGYALQTVGLQWTTVGKAGFITGLYVPLVPLFAFIVQRQRMPVLAIVGIILGLLGLFLLSLNGQLNLVFGRGEWLLLGCAFAFALQLVLVSKFAPQMDAINLAIIQLAVTAVLSFLAVPLAREPLALPPRIVWLPVCLLGTIDMAFCLLAMNWVQQFVSSTRAVLIYSLEPMWAVVFGVLFAGEVLSMPARLGCLCIFLGMIVGRLGQARFPVRERDPQFD